MTDHQHIIISRSTAKAAGLARYFTGKPCQKRHISERLVCNHQCVECLTLPEVKEQTRQRRRKIRAQAKEEGRMRYFTGKPCKRGHIAERWAYNGSCIECVRIKSTSEEQRLRFRVYYADNRERILPRRRANRKAEHRKAADRAYAKLANPARYRTNINYRLGRLLRGRLADFIVRGRHYRAGSMVRDLGCSLDQLRQHLEAQFDNFMTWDNHGEFWVIDHIKPLCSFDLTDRSQFLEACHYSNLRPLTKEYNIMKSAQDRRERRMITNAAACVQSGQPSQQECLQYTLHLPFR